MALTLEGSAAGCGRARRRGNEQTVGSLGPGTEGAAAARRSLARSLTPRASGRAGKAAGGETPGSEAAPLPGPRGGAGSALGLPHRRRRRRLRCGSEPNMAAAAALRTRGPGAGERQEGPALTARWAAGAPRSCGGGGGRRTWPAGGGGGGGCGGGG